MGGNISTPGKRETGVERKEGGEEGRGEGQVVSLKGEEEKGSEGGRRGGRKGDGREEEGEK